jgi:hypothetical protein
MSSEAGPDPITCPAEGCEYTGLPSSVLAHYSGKQDDQHVGGYFKAQQKIAGAEPAGGADAEPEAGPEAGSKPAENPIMGDANPKGPPNATDDSAGDRGERPDGCPDCDGELVDYREYATGEYHTIDGRDHYVQGDYLCTACGRWWVDE